LLTSKEGRWHGGAQRQNRARQLGVSVGGRQGEAKLRDDTALGGWGAVPVVGGGGVDCTSGEATGERSDAGMWVAFPMEATGERINSWKDTIWGVEMLVFFASARYRTVKIAHSGSEMVLRTTKHTIIYPDSDPSSEVIALRPTV
jgi:hypothetical protein